MTLLEMAQFICEKINKTDQTSIDLAKGFIQRRYSMICTQGNWRALQDLIVVPVAVGQAEVILTNRIDVVIAIRQGDSSTLSPVDMVNLFQTDPAIFEQSGTPLKFSPMIQSAVAASPAGGFINISSASTTDVNLQVRLRGMRNGEELREIITLSGTTPVVSSYQYDEITTLSKPTTSGSVSVKRDASSTEIQKLWEEETDRKHCRIKLLKTPDAATQLLLLVKVRPQPLSFDSDTPQLRNVENALCAYAMGDMLQRARQYAKAQEQFGEGRGHVSGMLDEENNQNARIIQMVPYVQTHEEF